MTRQIPIPTEEPKQTIAEAHLFNRYHLLVPLLKNTESGEPTYTACVPLSTMEQRQCANKAYQATLKDFEGKQPKQDDAGFGVWTQAYENYYGAHVIYTSYRLPDDLNKRLFPDVNQVLAYTPAEIGSMHSGYLTTEFNQPAIKHIDPDNPNSLSDLIDLIANQATVEDSSFFFRSFTSQAIAQLVRYLVEENTKLLQIVNGSVIMPSEDTTTI